MRHLLVIILFALSTSSYGQYVSNYTPKFETVKQDTINVKGTVFDTNGNPVSDLRFTSQNKHLVYSGYKIYTTTNRKGEFQLFGVMVPDTLDYIWNDKKMHIVLNGSRSLLLYLPVMEFNNKVIDTVIVAAQRKAKKKIPVFKVITNPDMHDYYGITSEDFKAPPRSRPGFVEYLKDNITYPEQAVKNNVEGDVEIGFNIDVSGKLSDFKVLRGIGFGCDEQVIKALEKSPEWWRGIVMGHPVETRSSVVISFKLTDKGAAPTDSKGSPLHN